VGDKTQLDRIIDLECEVRDIRRLIESMECDVKKGAVSVAGISVQRHKPYTLKAGDS